MMVQLSWSRDAEGIATVYAVASDGRRAPVADFWVQPLIDNFGMTRADALDWQKQFAGMLVSAHNKLFTKVGDGGFATQAPPSGLDSTPADRQGVSWVCPIGRSDCQETPQS